MRCQFTPSGVAGRAGVSVVAVACARMGLPSQCRCGWSVVFGPLVALPDTSNYTFESIKRLITREFSV